MTSLLNEIQKHAGTARKVRKRQICSKTKKIGREIAKTATRGSEIAEGQLKGRQQEEERNIRSDEMKGNNWGGKPAQNKARKNLQLLVKNCSLGGLNAFNCRSLNDFICRRSTLLERAKDKVLRAL